MAEAVFAVTPMETVKVKFIHDQTLEKPRFRGFVHGLSTIVKAEGLRVFDFIYLFIFPTVSVLP